jgi:hypothetical protein
MYPIYKLSFIIDMYVWGKTEYIGFSPIPSVRHPLGVLDHVPSGYRENTLDPFGVFFFFFNSGPHRCSTTWATPPALFCVGYFQDRDSQTIHQGWLWTEILLISALWVVRIRGVSQLHWNLQDDLTTSSPGSTMTMAWPQAIGSHHWSANS